MSKKRTILLRLGLAYTSVAILAVAIIVQIVRIQFVEGSRWIALADTLTTDYRPIEAERGNIFSSDGRMLATSLPFYELRMDMKAEGLTQANFSAGIDSLALCLSRHFKDKSKAEYYSQLLSARKAGNRYFLIRNNVSYPDLLVMKQWPIFRLGRYKGGLIILQHNKRIMPFKMLAHRTIGYVRDNAQHIGIEDAFNHYLAGTQGERLMQKIAGGTWIPVNDMDEIRAEPGKDIVTTIDINLQDVAEHALLKALQKHDADHGSVIVMEVATGKIKAIANLGITSSGDYWEEFNYAIGEATEPGSTMKLASIISLLEDNYVDVFDSVDITGGAFNFYDRVMKDSEEHDLRKVTLKKAFTISSNVGISKLIHLYYGTQQKKFVENLKQLDLHLATGIEIKGEPTPFIKEVSSKTWSGISLPWMSVGYEMTLTPLQVLSFYNAIANDGIRVRPTLVEAVQKNGEILKTFSEDEVSGRICSKSTLEKVKKLLEAVVTDEQGTAHHLSSKYYGIAGKTGTSLIANKGRYEKVYQSSFVGYFPADRPLYSCIVVINSPRSGVYYGGWVAGPVFREIADKVFSNALEMHPYIPDLQKSVADMPIPRGGYQFDLKEIYNELDIDALRDDDAEWVKARGNEKKVILTGADTPKGLVPDVRGMGLRDAIYLLENVGLIVQIEGKGKVKSQSVVPGSKAMKGKIVKINLS